ncbi:MAG: hypothetical protein V4563_17085 [Pseudomonadota bacterium]
MKQDYWKTKSLLKEADKLLSSIPKTKKEKREEKMANKNSAILQNRLRRHEDYRLNRGSYVG